MELQVLHPDVVRELLRGRTSCIPELVALDERAREEISNQLCPHAECGERLTPVVPGDAARVFDRTGVRYEKRCPVHGRVI